MNGRAAHCVGIHHRREEGVESDGVGRLNLPVNEDKHRADKFSQKGVPLRKKDEILKGGIHCISQVFPWHFYFMREHSLVGLTEHNDSAANIIVHSMYTYMYCCIHSTY